MLAYTCFIGVECGEGWYGVNCSQQCKGHCKDNAACNHMTGQCDKGCDSGWTGNLCDEGLLLNKITCFKISKNISCLDI